MPPREAARPAKSTWSTVAEGVETMLCLGEQLRQVYNDGTDAAQRHADHRATQWRVAGFGVLVAAVLASELRGVLRPAVAAAAP